LNSYSTGFTVYRYRYWVLVLAGPNYNGLFGIVLILVVRSCCIFCTCMCKIWRSETRCTAIPLNLLIQKLPSIFVIADGYRELCDTDGQFLVLLVNQPPVYFHSSLSNNSCCC